MVPVEWGMKRGAVNQCRTQDGAVRWVSKAGLYFHRNTQAHILMPPDKLGLPCHGQKKKKKKKLRGSSLVLYRARNSRALQKWGENFLHPIFALLSEAVFSKLYFPQHLEHHTDIFKIQICPCLPNFYVCISSSFLLPPLHFKAKKSVKLFSVYSSGSGLFFFLIQSLEVFLIISHTL